MTTNTAELRELHDDELATRLDLDFDRGVTAAGGVHIAALGGLWQALVLGFGGMTVDGGELRFAPHVPASWGSLRFRVRWRGDLLEVTPESWDRAFNVNVRGGFFLAQEMARRMLAAGAPRRGARSIVFITSANATLASPERGEYAASKSV